VEIIFGICFLIASRSAKGRGDGGKGVEGEATEESGCALGGAVLVASGESAAISALCAQVHTKLTCEKKKLLGLP
jgi:hypothetical protein